jgi:hypothetical protein
MSVPGVRIYIGGWGARRDEGPTLDVNTHMIAMRENHVRMFIKNPDALFQVICFVYQAAESLTLGVPKVGRL